ncbi:sulfite exporter TauE/SafE family protein [Foetidibacter luteolus]|uniref:sulfite exporter TauE/SafE family protein n=1 Tax=Foetidibacter luteolus TaxID=2608880 RepID=UPI00129A1B44|nr:sulfite exporter TauE/SafE family protein [Foetidibacter luteolus]
MDFSTTVLLFFLLAFASEVIGTISGFGSSVFFVPLAGMLFDFQTTLALTGILHIFSTSAQVLLFRKSINWKLTLLIGIPSVVMVMCGAYLNNKISLKYAELAMGIFLIAFAVSFLFNKNLKLQPSAFNAVTGGAVAGFLAGLIGTGGAIRGATLAAFDLPKNAFVATSAGIDFAVDLSRTVIYLANGYLRKEYFWFIPVLMVLAYAGAWTGKKILNKMPQEIFKKVVLSLILSVGILMVYGFISGSNIIR